ncbi:hypothetical protein HOT82_gp146 [Gordonia phage Ronaldo]|uniref:Uncharacterized protein n=4 Tax=Ronaldovirus TaxID=2733205 RepID=A0A6B9LAI2_9CAUD|nr:hypothetical protein HOT81_gp143 [Gordonia phage Fryberger]YP_009807823.1 hypothetical protein HOT82_gp146 [Gordonia phage Ronaldo]QDH48467.1 hypothetical protein SEA_ZIKO_131 [Gordonia phage Ziko]QHB38243.1 hypothetical protein SEA_VOLT_132 [Gordonia phage Volt]QTF81913.1 hypothetical protein SEA_GUEY18_132 [Gordonia phage Guey18]AXN53540.1 hypothetical protein SEA_FRYBERGER_127 [Gordonia phage Fryberger]AXN53689.1 hypothetical protein SEA_RONALDO_129 [Gordonia phage Ronaldo]
MEKPEVYDTPVYREMYKAGRVDSVDSAIIDCINYLSDDYDDLSTLVFTFTPMNLIDETDGHIVWGHLQECEYDDAGKPKAPADYVLMEVRLAKTEPKLKSI